MSVQYEPGTEGLADPTRHLKAALEAVAETARKLKEERDEAREERDIARLEVEEISHDLSDARTKIWMLENQIEGLNNFANERYEEIQKVRQERDEARAVIRMLWERAETHLDLSDEEIERVDRSWGETAK